MFKLLLLSWKNVRRNKLRVVLTSAALVLLASILCMVATVLFALNQITAEKSKDVKLIVTERYRIPSRFDRSYIEQIVRPGSTLHSELTRIPGFDAAKYTVWQIVGFTLDPQMRNKDQQFMVIATIPEKIPYMTDDLEELKPEIVELMKQPPKSGLPNIGVLIGTTRLKKLNKKVGDVFKARSFTHVEGNATRLPIEMEFEVVGELPLKSRWADGIFIDYSYLTRVLQAKKNESEGKVDIAWLIVADQEAAGRVSRTIENNIRDLKCETLATAVGRFLAPLRDFLWGVKYFVAPAILIVMVVIISNAISITVRERMTEMAIMKILGFRNGQILILILSEGAFIGAVAGLIGGGLTQWAVELSGGIQLGDGNPFFVSRHAWWWGPTVGILTAFLGGIIPAVLACRVKASQIFARVA